MKVYPSLEPGSLLWHGSISLSSGSCNSCLHKQEGNLFSGCDKGIPPSWNTSPSSGEPDLLQKLDTQSDFVGWRWGRDQTLQGRTDSPSRSHPGRDVCFSTQLWHKALGLWLLRIEVPALSVTRILMKKSWAGSVACRDATFPGIRGCSPSIICSENGLHNRNAVAHPRGIVLSHL